MTSSEPIHRAFAENFSSRGEVGASVCVWTDEGSVIDVAAGRVSREAPEGSWTADTLVPVWSTTKGPASAVLLSQLAAHGLDLAAPVARVWPELQAGGTFGQLLSHQLGLAALEVEASVFEHAAAVVSLERQEPAWPPGTRHGYHPRTFGTLVEECVRRLAGATVGEVWRRDFAEPLGLDVWLGLPESEFSRVATVQPGKLGPRAEEAAFAREFGTPGSLTRRAFASLRGLNAVADMNTPAAWQLGHPAFGGVATARGLARFYHALATDSRFDHIRPWMEAALVDGEDAVLHMPVAFSAGFQKDPVHHGTKVRRHYGRSPRAFGHPGAGGSLAFADPERRFAFAYVMNLVSPGVMPNDRALSLVAAVDEWADRV